MKFSRHDLDRAVEKGILTSEQAGRFCAEVLAKEDLAAEASNLSTVPRLNTTHVLFYFGGLLILSSLSWFLVDAWEQLGGVGILALAASYGIVFLYAGVRFWKTPALRIPGGIFCAISVALVPLAIYGFQRWMGWWPESDPGNYSQYYLRIHGSWIFLEVGTVAAGLLLLRWVRFPFITFPMSIAVWFLSMDLAVLFYGGAELDLNQKKWVSVIIGLALLAASYLADRKYREDFSFWGYLFGLLAFWGGLTAMNSTSELGKFVYCLINLGLIALALRLHRRVFMVFGAMGTLGYVGHLAHQVFKDDIEFTLFLTVLGIAVMAGGVWFQKRTKAELP